MIAFFTENASIFYNFILKKITTYKKIYLGIKK